MRRLILISVGLAPPSEELRKMSPDASRRRHSDFSGSELPSYNRRIEGLILPMGEKEIVLQGDLFICCNILQICHPLAALVTYLTRIARLFLPRRPSASWKSANRNACSRARSSSFQVSDSYLSRLGFGTEASAN